MFLGLFQKFAVLWVCRPYFTRSPEKSSFFFVQTVNVHFSVDATEDRYESYIASLINHSGKKPNLKRVAIEGGCPHQPRIMLIAKQDISFGQQLFYDYGIRSPKDHPFTLM